MTEPKTRTDLDSDARAALSCVAQAFGVEEGLIEGAGRDYMVITPRFTWYTILKNMGWNLTEIGQATGRTHGAIHSGIAKLKERVKGERDLGQAISKVRLDGYEV